MKGCPPAAGRTSANTLSACSRRGTATPPRRTTTSVSAGCRAWTPTTRNWPTSIAWPRVGVKGYFLAGQNPAGGGPNAGLHRAGLRQLDWLVVLDWFETESALFWKNDPNAPPPSDIKTEVFFIPAAA